MCSSVHDERRNTAIRQIFLSTFTNLSPSVAASDSFYSMAKRSIIESDLSGKPDADTVTFGWGGAGYDMDLTAEEQEEFEATLAPYLEGGRESERFGLDDGVGRRQVPITTAAERVQIREWAKEHYGGAVPEFGQIPKGIIEAYDRAHGLTRQTRPAEPRGRR